MDRQEIFDTVVKKLSKQGCIARGTDFDGLSKCRYYYVDADNRELRCAIGHLFPKKLAKQLAEISEGEKGLNDSGIGYIIKNKNTDELLKKISFPEWLNTKNSYFLTRLQQAHDEESNYSSKLLGREWLKSMKAIAKDYKLKKDVLEKVSSKFTEKED